MLPVAARDRLAHVTARETRVLGTAVDAPRATLVRSGCLSELSESQPGR